MANSPNGIIFDEYEDNDDDPDDHSYHPNNDNDNQDFPLAPNHFAPIAGVNDGLDDDDPPTLPSTAAIDDENDSSENTGVPTVSIEDMDHKYGSRMQSNMCPHQPQSYEHLHPMFHTVMTQQYHVNRGLKVFSSHGKEAV